MRLYDRIVRDGLDAPTNMRKDMVQAALKDFRDNILIHFQVDNLVNFGLAEFSDLGGLLVNQGPLRGLNAISLMPDSFFEARLPEKFHELYSASQIGAYVMVRDLWTSLTAEMTPDLSATFIVEWLSAARFHAPPSWDELTDYIPNLPIRYHVEITTFRYMEGGSKVRIMPWQTSVFLDAQGAVAFSTTGEVLAFSTLLTDPSNPHDPRLSPGQMIDLLNVRRGQIHEERTYPADPFPFFLLSLIIQRLPDTEIVRPLQPPDPDALKRGERPVQPYYTLVRPSTAVRDEINKGKVPTSATALSVPLDLFTAIP